MQHTLSGFVKGEVQLEIDNLELTPQEAQSTPETGAILGLLAVSSIGALARRKKG